LQVSSPVAQAALAAAVAPPDVPSQQLSASVFVTRKLAPFSISS